LSSPEFAPCRARFSASLTKPVTVNRFRTFAQNRQNGFVGLGKCFVKTSSQVALAGFVRKDGTAILIVEQDATSTLRIADRVHVPEHGRRVREGCSSDLAGYKYIQQVYLGV
jgi:hypothetical protein